MHLLPLPTPPYVGGGMVKGKSRIRKVNPCKAGASRFSTREDGTQTCSLPGCEAPAVNACTPHGNKGSSQSRISEQTHPKEAEILHLILPPALQIRNPGNLSKDLYTTRSEALFYFCNKRSEAITARHIFGTKGQNHAERAPSKTGGGTPDRCTNRRSGNQRLFSQPLNRLSGARHLP